MWAFNIRFKTCLCVQIKCGKAIKSQTNNGFASYIFLTLSGWNCELYEIQTLENYESNSEVNTFISCSNFRLRLCPLIFRLCHSKKKQNCNGTKPLHTFEIERQKPSNNHSHIIIIIRSFHQSSRNDLMWLVLFLGGSKAFSDKLQKQSLAWYQDYWKNPI